MEVVLGFFLVVLVIGGIIFGIRMLIGTGNHSRIRNTIAERGDNVIAIEWAPFGPGWFGSQNSVIYRVLYRTPEGEEHEVYAQTAPFGSVYFREDRIVRDAPRAYSQPARREPTRDELLEENRRLREQLRNMRK